MVDPFPTVSAVLHDRKEGAYLLPATTQFETSGSVTASNRSLQWREKVVEPLFDSKVDHEIMKLFADKFGFTDRMFRNIAIEGNEPVVEDITREFNRGMWTIGYTTSTRPHCVRWVAPAMVISTACHGHPGAHRK